MELCSYLSFPQVVVVSLEAILVEPGPGTGTRDQGTVNFIYHEHTILCHMISGGILVVFC